MDTSHSVTSFSTTQARTNRLTLIAKSLHNHLTTYLSSPLTTPTSATHIHTVTRSLKAALTHDALVLILTLRWRCDDTPCRARWLPVPDCAPDQTPTRCRWSRVAEVVIVIARVLPMATTGDRRANANEPTMLDAPTPPLMTTTPRWLQSHPVHYSQAPAPTASNGYWYPMTQVLNDADDVEY